jgi:hypothetical protein
MWLEIQEGLGARESTICTEKPPPGMGACTRACLANPFLSGDLLLIIPHLWDPVFQAVAESALAVS